MAMDWHCSMTESRSFWMPPPEATREHRYCVRAQIHMSTQNSIINIAELAAAMPNAILQISAGDLCDFANRLIESATDVARLQIERANLSKELLTIEEVADMLKVSKMTLYRWNLNDTLPKIEIGGKRRYRRADVEAIIEQRKEKKQWTKK